MYVYTALVRNFEYVLHSTRTCEQRCLLYGRLAHNLQRFGQLTRRLDALVQLSSNLVAEREWRTLAAGVLLW